MSPEFQPGDFVVTRRQAGVVMRRVRSDDDPRKCLLPGEHWLQPPNTTASRDVTAYIIRPHNDAKMAFTAAELVLPDLARLAPKGTPVMEQAKKLSPATIAYLIGSCDYRLIDEAHRAFFRHIVASSVSCRWPHWQAAWRWNANTQASTFPGFSEIDRLFVETATSGNAICSSAFDEERILKAAPITDLPQASASGCCPIRLGIVRQFWRGGPAFVEAVSKSMQHPQKAAA